MSKIYKRYAPDFKLRVVQAYHSSGKIQPEICAEFGISRSALCQWVKQYKNNGIEGLVNKKTTPKRPARQTAKTLPDNFTINNGMYFRGLISLFMHFQ